jgi:uncharacterized cupredoxin-like copper-binding protein
VPASRHPRRSSRPLLSVATPIVTCAVLLAACASGGASTQTPSGPAQSMAMSPESSMAMSPGASMEAGSGMDMGGGDETFEFGHSADASTADRVIDIEALDTLRFDPDQLDVKVGETVTLRLHNGGTTTHELVLGSPELQEEHEQEMEEMPEGVMMEDEANAISVAAGETKALTWTFTQAGTIQFACHEPEHYAGGMIGTIAIGA